MALMDDVLRDIVAAITPKAHDAGLRRMRGGIARGISWAEMSGRQTDGGWVELRLHHRPNEGRLQAGMLLYHPLSRGGRTEILGEASYTDPSYPQAASLALDILGWLNTLIDQQHPTELASQPLT